MTSSTPPTTFHTLLHHLCNFLTITLHQVAFSRSIYPSTSFLTTRAYNYPVSQSRHPGVCAWITDAVSSIHAELLKSSVERVVIVLAHPVSGTPLERFVFDVSRLARLPSGETGTPFVRNAAAARNEISMDEQFRATLAKIAQCDHRLKPIPKGCTLAVALELRDEADPPLGHPQPWIPVESGSQREKASVSEDGEMVAAPKKGNLLGGIKTVPLRTVDAGEMVFEAWVEESRSKLELNSVASSDSKDAS